MSESKTKQDTLNSYLSIFVMKYQKKYRLALVTVQQKVWNNVIFNQAAFHKYIQLIVNTTCSTLLTVILEEEAYEICR